MSNHDVPFFYKGLGAIQPSTLSNPLMDNYRLVLETFPGDAVDLFAHRTTRTAVSNQFDPLLDHPRPREPSTDGARNLIMHLPVTEADGLLKAIDRYRPSVVLIDPPYTPQQQQALYGDCKDQAKTWLVDTPVAIRRLYRLCWEWATQRTGYAILVYGYKLMPDDHPDWRRVATWAVGGGAHPAIVCHMFLHRRVTPAKTEHLLTRLEQHAHDAGAEVSRIAIHAKTHYHPEGYHPRQHCHALHRRLFETSSELKRYRDISDPKTHPAYLSASMYTLAMARTPCLIHTRLATLYQTCKVGKRKVRLSWSVKKRILWSDCDYADATFVLEPQYT